MDTFWMEQTGDDVPSGDGWLSPSEAVRLNGMRFPKRRADWRLGRWTAKCAVSKYLALSASPAALARIEIRPAAWGAPEAFLGCFRAPVSISLSHCSGRAACTIATLGGALGCDLELVECRSDTFLADYFTDTEQQSVARARAQDRPRLVTMLWSAKESALKALGVGLRLDTRCVVVKLLGADCDDASVWQPLTVDHTEGRTFHGWSRHSGNLVHTIVADPPGGPPVSYRVC